MKPKVIKTDREYEAALKRIGDLMGAQPGTPAGEELDLWATLAEQYGNSKFPIEPPSPIEAIRFRMDQAGLRPKDLVPYIGTRGKVSEVLSGKRPLSLAMIRSLNQGLGIPAESLLSDTGQYLPENSDRLDWARFPIKEMARFGWISRGSNSLIKTRESAKEAIFSMISSLGGMELEPAFLRQHIRSGSSANHYALLAWRLRILSQATLQSILPYKPGSISAAFTSELAHISALENGAQLARKYLKEHGIYLIIERHLPGTHLDGAAMKAADGKPLIALTLRYDRLDNFWFTLFHELAHVALHLNTSKNSVFLDDLEYRNVDTPEKEADRWAENALIPPDSWRKLRRTRSLSPFKIRKFANELMISPAIAVGRLRRERNNYRLLANMVGSGEVRKQFGMNKS